MFLKGEELSQAEFQASVQLSKESLRLQSNVQEHLHYCHIRHLNLGVKMEIILLERVVNLGTIGDVVNVKNGYARNFLLPRKKAIRATKVNKDLFEKQKAEIEAKNAAAKAAAEELALSFTDISAILVRQAGDDGRLYGSVTNKEIAEAIALKAGVNVAASMIILASKIKDIGSYNVEIELHPEVKVSVNVVVSRGEGSSAN
jgi:large subunit ribosomal protein L9